MQQLDEQEKKILRELVINPRISDNQIGKITKVPIRTVNRKRKLLEENGILQYYTKLNLGLQGTGRFGAIGAYIIRFRIGVKLKKIIEEIMAEPNVKTIFTQHILNSFLIEKNGHIGLLLIIEGKDNTEITDVFNSIILPSLEKNHGKNCFEDVESIQILKEIRYFHNYVPMLNMEKGFIKKDWHKGSIFIE